MARNQDTTLLKAMTSIINRTHVENEARRLGVVRRKRTVDIYVLVWTLVLGFQEGAARTIASLRQAYGRRTGDNLVPSAFYNRLSSSLAKLLRSLALDALNSLEVGFKLPTGALAGFRDLLAIDATVIRLHDLLAEKYAACRTNHTKAAAKLHMVMSVLSGSPKRVKLTSERVGDSTPWRRVGKWVRGSLLLFDLGYYRFHLFDRIDANGGFFLSRVKTNANFRITAVNRRWRGRRVDVVGRKLREVLADIQRGVLDVMVEVSFKKRGYAGHRNTKTRTFRLVAVRNEETGDYHCYITNVPADRLAAEDISSTYALRWQVEILFKAMKTHGNLVDLPSEKAQVVECLVWASVLATVISQILFREVRRRVAADRHMPLLRWAAIFGRVAAELLGIVIRGRASSSHLMQTLSKEAPDPNRNRKRRSLSEVPQATYA